MTPFPDSDVQDDIDDVHPDRERDVFQLESSQDTLDPAIVLIGLGRGHLTEGDKVSAANEAEGAGVGISTKLSRGHGGSPSGDRNAIAPPQHSRQQKVSTTGSRIDSKKR